MKKDNGRGRGDRSRETQKQGERREAGEKILSEEREGSNSVKFSHH